MAQQSNSGDLNPHPQQQQQQQGWQQQQPHQYQQQWMAMQYPATAMAMMQQQMMMYPQHYMPYVHHHYQPQQQQQPQQQPPPQPPQHHHHSHHQQQLKQGGSADEIRTIWLGDLHHWMDENYLHNCFAHTGEVYSLSPPHYCLDVEIECARFVVCFLSGFNKMMLTHIIISTPCQILFLYKST